MHVTAHMKWPMLHIVISVISFVSFKISGQSLYIAATHAYSIHAHNYTGITSKIPMYHMHVYVGFQRNNYYDSYLTIVMCVAHKNRRYGIIAIMSYTSV